MSFVTINSRNAYSEKELGFMIRNKIQQEGNTYSEIYKRYKKYFVNEKEFLGLVNDEIDFCFDHYLFIEDYLGILVEESTAIVEDKVIISARGELNTQEEIDFVGMLNFIFDRLIDIERYKVGYLCSSADFMSLRYEAENTVSDKARYTMRAIDYKIGDDLTDIIENRSGYYLAEFPNDIGISGITLIKEGKVEDQKLICIYINTKEPKGRRNYTLAHELYHVFCETSKTQISYYSNKDEVEKRADEFASYFQFDEDLLLEDVINLEKSLITEILFDEIVDLQIKYKASFIGTFTALKRLKKKYADNMLSKSIPNLPDTFFKYKHPDYWNELEARTNRRTVLNCSGLDYIIPKQLRNISYDEIVSFVNSREVNTLFNFFEIGGGDNAS